jgi:hypothetical protein
MRYNNSINNVRNLDLLNMSMSTSDLPAEEARILPLVKLARLYQIEQDTWYIHVSKPTIPSFGRPDTTISEK